ncbi:MAG: Caldesmon [Bacteroidetes bacterium CG23_combo_of_CG06-09_8_20_14_all_32_9]|nr:MAG: Caldesmon [Bacteroidetes bacterium CG23_combo_of_CG06-09_8_20_14_all_32_9]
MEEQVTNTKINCPKCGHEFNVEDVLAHQIEEKYKMELNNKISEIESDFKKKENSLAKKESELKQKTADIEQQIEAKTKLEVDKKEKEIKKKIQEDYEGQLSQLNADLESKRKENLDLRKIELENIKLKNDLDLQKIHIEAEFEKKRKEELKTLTTTLKENFRDEFELQLKDKDQQLSTLKEQIEIMKKKSEQGSQQQQGEVLENYVEEILKDAHPFDRIEEIKKGQHGADILQIVVNNTGNECGKILYECKRAKTFKNEWIDKLKSDALEAKAELKVLVTEALPDRVEKISIVDGICICKYQDVKGVSALLRDRLIQTSFLNSSQINKGEKMQMLYDYLISEEFKMQLTGIIEGFNELQHSYIDEKKKMQALWKQREKQLEKILLRTTGFYGSIRGIAGANAPVIELLETPKLILELNENREPQRKSKNNLEDIEL